VKSTVERLSPTRVRINVEVPFDELKPDFDRAYRKIAQQVRIPGFRPGKAPARILEARLGRGVVLDEVVNAAIPVKYSEAITGADEVNPIGRPDIEVTEIADGDHLAFTAEVDVRPDITLPDIDSIAVTVDDVEVDDAAVTEELENLRARFGTLSGVERPAADGDFVLLDLSATVDGETLEEATTSGFSYQLGEGGLIDGLDEAVRGLSAGESTTFTSQLLAGEQAGKDAEITATVTAVKERELPEADDEFAQLASEFDTLDELTDDLRTRLGQVKRMGQVTQARDKVLEAIVDATDVPLPESVVAAEVESRVHDAVHAFDHDDDRFTQFLDAQGKSREEFDADLRTEAERNVKTRLVLDALAEQEQVSVNDQELTERIIFQAQQYQMPPEEFVRRIQEAGQLGAVYSDVRRSKALIAAVAAATVTDESGAAVDMSDLIGSADDDTVDVGVDDVDADDVEAADSDAEGVSQADPAAVETAQEAADADDTDDLPAADGTGATQAEAPASEGTAVPESGRAAAPTA
jgi:trigger factor